MYITGLLQWLTGLPVHNGTCSSTPPTNLEDAPPLVSLFLGKFCGLYLPYGNYFWM